MSDADSECECEFEDAVNGSYFAPAHDEESRIDMKQYLYDGEIDLLNHYAKIPQFTTTEFSIMMYDDDASSFNDDGIPDSENELFSSPWYECDVGDYVPPLTRNKSLLLQRIKENQFNENDSSNEIAAKRNLRKQAILDFKDYVIKKRAIKAFKRLRKVQKAHIESIQQQAKFLEKLELVDKKLNRDYYYEPMEPKAYKNLLQKRKKAVRQKYELYAVDPSYRKKVIDRTIEFVQNIVADTNLNNTMDSLYETGLGFPDEVDQSEAEIMPVQDKREEKQEQKQEQEKEPNSDEDSSMYDDIIGDSEREFFLSDLEEIQEPHPEPKSRHIDKCNRLLKACRPLCNDFEEDKKRKHIQALDIVAQFQKFRDRRRAIKGLARIRAIEIMNLDDPVKEAEQLIHMEIMDKKLHKSYYYAENEPVEYKKLLLKRRAAIIRKYEFYAENADFRKFVKDDAYLEFMKTQPVPLFEDLKSESDEDLDESSFNDTEIPTSEEDFLSSGEIQFPENFVKPITRHKADLYEKLQLCEPSPGDTKTVELQKNKEREDVIKNFKDNLINRRRKKAAARLDKLKQLRLNDPGSRAKKLEELELRDKKLNRGYYYMPKEPKTYKKLLKKRLRAIHRKYQVYYRDEIFREEMEARIIAQAKEKAAPWQLFGNEYDEEEEYETLPPEEDNNLFNLSVVGGSTVEGETKCMRQRRRAEEKGNRWRMRKLMFYWNQ